ncbi:MAG: hypothetical protein EHM64_12570 [Ignavibacteriae bacterium]|nr:MAG: hypothetical protein EHM64_12570 [Ignavibacteriota bacterium]
MKSRILYLTVLLSFISIAGWNGKKDLQTNDGNSAQNNFVSVAGGPFIADSTPVAISSFTVDRYEVTYELWTEVKNWGLSHGYTDLAGGENGCRPVGSNNPVTGVNWYDVVKWCNARSEKDGLTPVYYIDSTRSAVYRTGQVDVNNDAVQWTANGYRLPTECEWEYAARGGILTHGFTYSGSNAIDDVAWVYANSDDATHPVGKKKANELGIYDMNGNVWEWCWDWFAEAHPPGGTTDPKGPAANQGFRIQRGASFDCRDFNCSLDFRLSDLSMTLPEYRDANPAIGFRCVRK